MDEQKLRQQLHRAAETRLSELQGDPWLAQRVMAQAKGEPKVKKKLSVGFVLVIVLVLVAVTALAITLLSSKDFIEQIMAPSAQKTNSVFWSSEEVDAILNAADKNGIEINDDIRQRVESASNVSKEELMRAFARLELAPQPASWSIEDQAWYDELLVACGLRDERTRFIPSDNEITEQEALSIAVQYIDANVNGSEEITDEDRYAHYVQYMLTEDNSGKRKKVWDVEYESIDKTGASFYIVISSDGTVLSDESYQRAPESVTPSPKVGSLSLDELAMQIDNNDFFTVENMADFAEKYGELIRNSSDTQGTRYSALRNLLNIPYGEPREDDVTETEALSTANTAILKHGWTDTWLNRCKFTISYRTYEEAAPVWRVCYKIDGTHAENYAFFHQGEMPFGIVVYIDAVSGSIQSIQQLDEMDRFDYYM